MRETPSKARDEVSSGSYGRDRLKHIGLRVLRADTSSSGLHPIRAWGEWGRVVPIRPRVAGVGPMTEPIRSGIALPEGQWGDSRQVV